MKKTSPAVLMAGLALMSAVMGLPLGAETPAIPADVIQIVVEGINPGSVTIERVSPDMREPDAKLVATMVSLAKGKPEELLKISEEFQKFMVLTTNTLQILTRTPGVGLVEQSFSSADSTNVSRGRYGWTPHFTWDHMERESMAWVVPVTELAHFKNDSAQRRAESNEAHRVGNENLLHNLGLVWLGGSKIRHNPETGVFVATLGIHAVQKFKTNEVVLHPHWEGNLLELTYEFPLSGSRFSSSLVIPLPERYLAQIQFVTSAEGRRLLESVRTYTMPDFQARPDPRALVEAVRFRDMGPPKISDEEARAPMHHLKWKEWFELLNGRWVIRNRDGSTMDLPNWDKPTPFWGLGPTTNLLLWIFSGFILLLVVRFIRENIAVKKTIDNHAN
jgi:hypothetical protein